VSIITVYFMMQFTSFIELIHACTIENKEQG